MSQLYIATTLQLQLYLRICAVVSDAATHLVLTSRPFSSGTFCPGPAVFTCNATMTSIEGVLYWSLSNIRISEYSFNSRDRYPLNLTLTSPNNIHINLIQVVSASVTQNRSIIEVVSTLSVSDVSVLNRMSLHCEDRFQQSNIFHVTVFYRGT